MGTDNEDAHWSGRGEQAFIEELDGGDTELVGEDATIAMLAKLAAGRTPPLRRPSGRSTWLLAVQGTA
jgi:hypothetical protein